MAWIRVHARPSGGGGGGCADFLAIEASGTAFDLSDSGSSTTKIADYALYNNLNLENIDLSSVVEVGEHAFDGCNNVQSINLPNCEVVGSYAFTCGRTNATARTYTSINLPKCTELKDYAFRNYDLVGCRSLTFPELTTIGRYAFSALGNVGGQAMYFQVAELNLPKVETIAQYGLNGMDIGEIKFGSSLQSMGTSVFGNTTVGSIYCEATSPPQVQSWGSGFSLVGLIYVPAGTDPVSGKTYVEIYQDAPRWSTYSTQIRAMSTT